jgi:hypothetical protein
MIKTNKKTVIAPPNSLMQGLVPWRSGIAPESIGGVYGHNAMGSNPSASPLV